MTKIIINENTQLPDDMTQEELDEMLANIQKMADDGTLEFFSEPVSEEEMEALGISMGEFFEEPKLN